MHSQTIQSSMVLREDAVNATDTEGSRWRLIAAEMIYLLNGALGVVWKAIPITELHHGPTRSAKERHRRAA